MCTAPPFWARPAISIMPAPLPSICAACASTAPMVTTPVPPTPVMRTFHVPSISGSVGRGQIRQVDLGRRLLAQWCAPSSVTKDGQNPLRQEKSLLQDDWSMARLRPNSVSTGTIETQFDCTPQSPQPSQTSVLMKTRRSGSGKVPRLRRRRFLGRAGLDVDDRRDALDLQNLPAPHQLVALVAFDALAGKRDRSISSFSS
jgi:hypothetical protein